MLKTTLEVFFVTTFIWVQETVYAFILTFISGFLNEEIKQDIVDLKVVLSLIVSFLIAIYYVLKIKKTNKHE